MSILEEIQRGLSVLHLINVRETREIVIHRMNSKSQSHPPFDGRQGQEGSVQGLEPDDLPGISRHWPELLLHLHHLPCHPLVLLQEDCTMGAAHCVSFGEAAWCSWPWHCVHHPLAGPAQSR